MGQMGPPAPPDNEEIDISGNGTTVGGNSATANTTETKISPNGTGTVIKFKLTRKVSGVQQNPVDITGIQLPFGTVELQIMREDDNSAAWQKGTSPLGAYASYTSDDWPADIVTPSATPTTSMQYCTGLGRNRSWTSMNFSDFVSIAFRTSR